ncbi:hypothetical protein ATCC90586_002827 [Pythium insidiosum]|nr:hypothetical protein ATCC90586_002827 [Pythium insidiosum]
MTARVCRAQDGKSDLEVHRIHVRKVLSLLREHQLYASLKKCIFAASDIPISGCFASKNGVRPDPEKIKVIAERPPRASVKDLRKFLGLATDLHKYSRNYALPLSSLLKKDMEWAWSVECQQAFDSIKKSLMDDPVLAIANQDKSFYVVCDNDGAERVISYQSRRLNSAERNYPVHDKELLAMKYALAKFRVYLLGDRHFTVYTDHASLRTAVRTPHISQRMARWLSFFAEYNFSVEYKPGRFNVVADALSRRPDFEPTPEDNAVSAVTASRLTSSSSDDVKRAYEHDQGIMSVIKHICDPSEQTLKELSPSYRSKLHRYALKDGLLMYRSIQDDNYPVVVPDSHDLKLEIMFGYHDVPSSGHRGREKTYLTLSRDFYWSNDYKYMRNLLEHPEKLLVVVKELLMLLPLLLELAREVPAQLLESVRATLKELSPSYRSKLHRYALKDGLLMYRSMQDDNYRVVVPDSHDLKLEIMFEYHDVPSSGHRGREKTYFTLSRDFYWSNEYKYVRKYVHPASSKEDADACFVRIIGTTLPAHLRDASLLEHPEKPLVVVKELLMHLPLLLELAREVPAQHLESVRAAGCAGS